MSVKNKLRKARKYLKELRALKEEMEQLSLELAKPPPPLHGKDKKRVDKIQLALNRGASILEDYKVLLEGKDPGKIFNQLQHILHLAEHLEGEIQKVTRNIKLGIKEISEAKGKLRKGIRKEIKQAYSQFMAKLELLDRMPHILDSIKMLHQRLNFIETNLAPKLDPSKLSCNPFANPFINPPTTTKKE